MKSIFLDTKLLFLAIFITLIPTESSANDILGCGGFVKSHVKLDFSEIEIGLYTKEGSLKEKTECAPTNGYYFLPLYEKGEYILKVHPPAGLSFEPSEVALAVDGETDKCSTGQDINFAFNGFGINGRVVTQGQQQGPSGISVTLVNEKGETRDTVTTIGGDFHFTAVIPGKYTVKASHPRWKIEPSQAEVQMNEGKMALPLGVVLTVKGYDVKGSVTSFGSPIEGIYVLLYSKEENPKYRVEGCNTALLQQVPDSPICHVRTDAQGEFEFGLVPAGDYHLVALATSPGQAELIYNIKPDAVPFSVRHDSLFIKNAFEVTGFTVVGSVVAAPGTALAGARVLLDGAPVATSDAAGKFTLAGLQPGDYTVSFQHEQCTVGDVSLSVGPGGPRGRVTARAARWRVCGSVVPPAARAVSLRPQGGTPATVTVKDDGSWCTFVPPGVYTARVDVSEQEQREGLQYYPVSQQVTVGHSAVGGVAFSQLKARVAGRVLCLEPAACAGLAVTLRALAPDGSYVGEPRHTTLVDGEYVFADVLPGSVEVSAAAARLCWAEARLNAAVAQARTELPPFQHTGYVIKLHSTHEVEVQYTSKSSSGVVTAPRGSGTACVPARELYTLTPRGCHRFQPPQITVDTAAAEPPTAYLVAVAHAAGVRVTSPLAVNDLVLSIDTDGRSGERVGPLAHTQDGAMYVYEHTLYLADGEVASVSASSATLLFQPSTPTQVIGTGECQPAAVTLRARRALTLAGRLVPPVEGVTVTLTSDSGTMSQMTTSAGTYRFGPLDASVSYSVAAEKESYVFSSPDENGDIQAHKLAEIIVELVDDADGKPLEGALVSVSGGAYRRSAQAADGILRFTSLSPADYYVKPNMKEYKFTPPHKLLTVQEGKTHKLTLRGVRVAWSCVGSLVSLGGQGWAGAVVGAAPISGATCSAEEATTDASGAFRIRGLVPSCEYRLYLKEAATPELAGLRLARAPPVLKVTSGRDITDVSLVGVQRASLTDASALVRAAPEHYRALRLTLAAARAPATPIYSTRLDAAGFTPQNNPGVMYVLPRLPADNRSYIVSLEASLSRAAHTYPDYEHTFVSDGSFKFIHFEFEPKVKSSEQELRQSSFLLIPLVGILGLAYAMRERVVAAWPRARAPRPARPAPRPDVLDKASIDQILSTVNAAGKKQPKKKAL